MKNKTRPCVILTAVILLCFTTADHAASTSKVSIRVTGLRAEKKAGKYEISCIVTHRGLKPVFFTDSTVPVSNDKYIVHGMFPQNTIKERDFLMAQINYDLNGNKNLDDVYTVTKSKNTLQIENRTISLISSTSGKLTQLHYMNPAGTQKTFKIGKNGLPFFIYTADYHRKKITAGLGTRSRPLALMQKPNPNIEIVVMKTINSVPQKIHYTIAGDKNHQFFTNEKIIPDQADNWLSCAATYKKIDLNKSRKKYTFTVHAITPPFAVKARANLSFDKARRIQSQEIHLIVR